MPPILGPLRTMWFQPRATAKDVLNFEATEGLIMFMAFLAGTLGALPTAVPQMLSENNTAVTASIVNIIVAGIVSVPFFYIGTWIVQKIGQLLGGTAEFSDVRMATAWGNLLPGMLVVILVSIMVALSFKAENEGLGQIFGLIQLILGFWIFMIYLNFIVEANDFSLLRGLITIMVSLILIFGMVMIAGILAVNIGLSF